MDDVSGVARAGVATFGAAATGAASATAAATAAAAGSAVAVATSAVAVTAAVVVVPRPAPCEPDRLRFASAALFPTTPRLYLENLRFRLRPINEEEEKGGG